MTEIIEKPKTTALAQWYGSNRLLAEQVGKALAGLAWVGVPFAGGMCELLYIRARSVVVNDLHRHVVNLARVASHPTLGPRLYRELRRTPFHPIALIAAQSRCREREATGKCPYNGESLFGLKVEDVCFPDLEWARDYFVASWMTQGGKAGTDAEFKGSMSVRWNAGGGDSAVRFQSAISGLPRWRRVLRRCTFQVMDGLEFVGNIKDESGHGVYCDPPFPGPGDKYKHAMSDADHRKLAALLSRFERTKVVCRFYDHPLVRELYDESRWDWRHMDGGRKRTNEDAPEKMLVRN